MTARRILVLATESLDMMRGVTGVVGDSLDRADAWVGRLRAVGLQRNQSSDIEIPGVNGHSSNASTTDADAGASTSGTDYFNSHLGHRQHSAEYDAEGGSTAPGTPYPIPEDPPTPGTRPAISSDRDVPHIGSLSLKHRNPDAVLEEKEMEVDDAL